MILNIKIEKRKGKRKVRLGKEMGKGRVRKGKGKVQER